MYAHFGPFWPILANLRPCPWSGKDRVAMGMNGVDLSKTRTPPPYVALNIHGGPRDYESGEVLTFTSYWLCHGLFLTHYQHHIITLIKKKMRATWPSCTSGTIYIPLCNPCYLLSTDEFWYDDFIIRITRYDNSVGKIMTAMTSGLSRILIILILFLGRIMHSFRFNFLLILFSTRT